MKLFAAVIGSMFDVGALTDEFGGGSVRSRSVRGLSCHWPVFLPRNAAMKDMSVDRRWFNPIGRIEGAD